MRVARVVSCVVMRWHARWQSMLSCVIVQRHAWCLVSSLKVQGLELRSTASIDLGFGVRNEASGLSNSVLGFRDAVSQIGD
eukprot:1609348-Rhodomonas_salina.1